MKNLPQEKASATVAVQPLARLGEAHGYRLAADTVHVNAMFTVLDAAAHQRAWALQLWACPVAPDAAIHITGQLVAEMPLPPIGELADDTHGFDTSAHAVLPTGHDEHVMVLALVAERAGRFDDVQDFCAYPRRERFLHPRLAGAIGFRVEGERVTIDAERIENPRDTANVSGTLAVELWALSEPYSGGRFQGTPLAGVAFDPLSGRFEYRQRSFELPFTTPPVGNWIVTLMLREWTALGYVTRDFVNFPLPLTIGGSARGSEVAPERAKAKPPESVAPKADGTVSVNEASHEELATVKGLPPKVVDGIVSKRPFSSLDELVKVKGMGAKLLAKLRSRLRL